MSNPVHTKLGITTTGLPSTTPSATPATAISSSAGIPIGGVVGGPQQLNASGLPIVNHPTPNLARLAHMPQNIAGGVTSATAIPKPLNVAPSTTTTTTSNPLSSSSSSAPPGTSGATTAGFTPQQLQMQALHAPSSSSAVSSSSSIGILTADDNEIISRRKLHELVAQLSPHEKLDPEVEEVLIEFIEDFIEQVTSSACNLAKHRNSNVLEVKDLMCHLERNWNIRIPGYGSTAAEGAPVKPFKRPSSSQAHQTRLALVKKSLAPPAKHARTTNSSASSSANNEAP